MLKDINGLHLYFYYYGEVHLSVNLFQYIKTGLENGEVIYLYADSDTLDAVGEFDIPNLSSETIKYVSLKEAIEDQKEEILHERSGQGTRWIMKADHAVRETDLDKFRSFEARLSEIVAGTDISMLCLYDFEEYLESPHKVSIDPEKYHQYQLSEFKLRRAY